MPPPEKLNCKLLMPDGDGGMEGRMEGGTDSRAGVTPYALSTILRMVGGRGGVIKIIY